MLMMIIIIMIIHLFPGAFQDTRGHLAKHSGLFSLGISFITMGVKRCFGVLWDN